MLVEDFTEQADLLQNYAVEAIIAVAETNVPNAIKLAQFKRIIEKTANDVDDLGRRNAHFLLSDETTEEI